MRKIIVAAMVMVMVTPALAGGRSGGRLDAITAGRIYDRLLTPSLNPDFSLQPRAQRAYERDVREGRIKPHKRRARRGPFLFGWQ